MRRTCVRGPRHAPVRRSGPVRVRSRQRQAASHPARVHDRSGDAPAGVDLLSGTYGVNRRQATFTARVRDLTDTTFLAFEIWPLTDAWDRLAVFKENGKVVGKVYFVDNSLEDSNQPVPHLVKCRDLQVRWHQAAAPSASLAAVLPTGIARLDLPFELHVFSGSAACGLPARLAARPDARLLTRR